MIFYYPDKNTLKEVMATKMSLPIIKNLCRLNGVFLFSQSQDEILEVASLIFWGYNEINILSEAIDDSKNYKKSIRYQLKPEQDNSLLYESFIQLIDHQKRVQRDDAYIRIEDVRNIQLPEHGPNKTTQEVTIKHIKRQPGHVRLLDEVEHNFTMYATQEEDGSISIDVVHNDASDLKIVKDLLSPLTANDKKIDIKQVSLSSLATKNKVALFDRFFQYSHNDWLREGIKSIKVERDDEIEEDTDDNVEEDLLTGINSALLHGNGLRTNYFVQNCLDKGYYFTQTSIKYSHSREAITIVIDISFKEKDRYMEIAIAGSYEIEGDKEYKKVFSKEEQSEYMRYFHSVIYNIYSDLLEGQKQLSENVSGNNETGNSGPTD